MLSSIKVNKLLIGIMVLGLLASLVINYQRHMVEQVNRQVEFVMEYEDIADLAQQEGVELTALLAKLKVAGITSLTVYETTLDRLQKTGKVTVLTGSDLLLQQRSGQLHDKFWQDAIITGKIKAGDVVVMAPSGVPLAELQQDLLLRLGRDRVASLQFGQQPVLVVKADWNKLKKWNLGLPTDTMRFIADQGFMVIPRPSNYTKVNAEQIQAVFARINSVHNISAVIFAGQEVLGYPNLLAVTAAGLNQRQLTLGMIESPVQLQFMKQDGLLDLATLNKYRSARIYVIPKDEQLKLTLAQAVHRWPITDDERNIRINLLRSFQKPERGKDLIETNLEYIRQVKQGVEARGLAVGQATVFPAYFPSSWLLAVIVLGATAAGWLYLLLLFPHKERLVLILFILSAAVLTVPVLLGRGMLVRQAAALAGAVLFPVLAMTWQLDRWRKLRPDTEFRLGKVIILAISWLTAMVAVSMVGGLYTGALLSDVRFLLEMEIYRGVKLTFIAPILLITLIYLTRYDLLSSRNNTPPSIYRQICNILNYPVYIKTLLVFGLGAVVAWIFVGRSGHTAGVPVPALEIKMRSFLEEIMYARPREKEFLIGHPGFFLALMAAYRGWPRILHYILVVAAVIGQGSLAQTFAHLRTPVIMSIIRGVDGLAVGIVIGIAAVIGAHILSSLSHLLGREYSQR